MDGIEGGINWEGGREGEREKGLSISFLEFRFPSGAENGNLQVRTTGVCPQDSDTQENWGGDSGGGGNRRGVNVEFSGKGCKVEKKGE